MKTITEFLVKKHQQKKDQYKLFGNLKKGDKFYYANSQDKYTNEVTIKHVTQNYGELLVVFYYDDPSVESTIILPIDVKDSCEYDAIIRMHGERVTWVYSTYKEYVDTYKF